MSAQFDLSKIRNFSIIAHVDHGKSTLADRLLEYTGTITEREKMDQFLDQMDIERERGITIKAQTVRMEYNAKDGNKYLLNLIDTPGHVDFIYEVSRSLSACEGAVLVVDASQGVEAQTLANAYLAIDANLEIIPAINKIDLPVADIPRVKKEIEEIVGLSTENAVLLSAKEGIGTQDILEAIVKYIPPPKGDINAPLKALIFDSWFNPYLGVIVLVRVFDGSIEIGMKIEVVSTGKIFEVSKVGVFAPKMKEVERLYPGEVGFISAGIKEVKDTKIGDTITDPQRRTLFPFPGFKEIKPMVFSGIYIADLGDYNLLKDALEKLSLNDSGLSYEPESSLALGFGFRCGFLGLLHMEIIQERLEREYNLSLIATSPTVRYKVTMLNEEVIFIENPSKLPPPNKIKSIEEPFVLATIYQPSEYVGPIIKLCTEKRGIQKDITYIGGNRVLIHYELPFNEILIDFHDKIKSLSRGYASFDYEFIDYRVSDLVKVDIRINNEPVDALSLIVHRDKAYERGKELVTKMRQLIPRQLYDVAIQAAIGNRVIARETVKALRKNVIAKCYGGDITRKRKLLEKQKEGKKRMKQLGSVEIPQEAFLAILKIKD